jgi:NAD(P)-dependent dehydrogenase (short-subunit alcohol dehydrogenase family)
VTRAREEYSNDHARRPGHCIFQPAGAASTRRASPQFATPDNMAEQTFANQVALVTGAGEGIGRAVAAELAARGASVFLVARTGEKLDALREKITADGKTAWALPSDVTNDAHAAAIADAVRERYGRLDILVHSAGEYARGNLDTMPVGDLDRLYRTNVRAPYLLTQLLLPLLIPVRGQIVFVNSTAATVAAAGLSGYASSKHALKAIADALRDEVNPLGVRVASVYPGRTNTPMQERVHALEGKPLDRDRLVQPEQVAEVIVATLALSPGAEVTNVTVRPAQPPSNTAAGG